MTLINWSGGLKNGRCYSILGNVNVYTQGAGMNYEMGGTILSKIVKEKDLNIDEAKLNAKYVVIRRA